MWLGGAGSCDIPMVKEEKDDDDGGIENEVFSKIGEDDL